MARGKKPSLNAMLEEEEKHIRELKSVISQCVLLDLENTSQLHSFITDLKQAARIFEMSSRTLFDYYMRQGATNEANATRQTRYTLIHTEVEDCIRIVNASLRALGHPPVSDVETASHASLMPQRLESTAAKRSDEDLGPHTKPSGSQSGPLVAQGQAGTTPEESNPSLHTPVPTDQHMKARGKTLCFTNPVHQSTPFNPNAPPYHLSVGSGHANYPQFQIPSNPELPFSALRITDQEVPERQNEEFSTPTHGFPRTPFPPSTPHPQPDETASGLPAPTRDQELFDLPLGTTAFNYVPSIPPVHDSSPPPSTSKESRVAYGVQQTPSAYQTAYQSDYQAPRSTGNTPPPHLSISPHQNPPHPTHHPASTLPVYPTPYPVVDRSHYDRLRADLKAGPNNPYSGVTLFYPQWKILLCRRMDEALMNDPLDRIQSIINNLKGPLQDQVQRFLAAGIRDPPSCLALIWEHLDEREGRGLSEAVDDDIQRLPILKDPVTVNQLDRVITACRMANSAISMHPDLGYLNAPKGIKLILDKLPPRFSRKWSELHIKRLDERGVGPKFGDLVDFLTHEVRHLNLPYSSNPRPKYRALTTKREEEGYGFPQAEISCYFHQSSDHRTVECPQFQQLGYEERRKIASDNRLCFNCLEAHYASHCTARVRCDNCGGAHITLMHWDADRGYSSKWGPINRWDGNRTKEHSSRGPGRGGYLGNSYQKEHSSNTHPGKGPREHSGWARRAPSNSSNNAQPPWRQGRDSNVYQPPSKRFDNRSSGQPQEPRVSNVKNTCTLVCGYQGKSRICSKTILVDITHRDIPGSMRGYCIVDEQSNASFCDQAVLDFFSPNTFAEDYQITTMNGIEKVQGVSVPGISVKGVHESESHALPSLFMHPNLPDTTAEVATQDMVRAHPHIASLSNHFPRFVGDYPMLLLIGADCGSLMKSETIGSHPPYIHRTPLGYAVVGPVCPQSNKVGPLKALCTNVQVNSNAPSCNLKRSFIPNYSKKELETPFETREDDEMKGYSQENLLFMDIINEGVTVNEKGHIEMPLPMRPGAEVPKNRSAVLGRTISTLNRLKRDEKKLASSLKAFGEYLAAGHVAEASPLPPESPKQVCFLPIFPVFNPHKDGARLVLDPSLTTEGKSLNNALLSGPDETNKLVGVLIRFRVGEIGFSADVEKMFHAFYVSEDQRDLFRFFWFKNNCPTSPIVEYRSNVMIFGSKSSPACANFGLRFAALSQAGDKFPASRHFLLNNMYIDDALGSADTPEEAIQILSGSVSILNQYKIRLHKFNSSSTAVLKALPSSELSESVATLPTLADSRTLGLVWRPQEDTLGIASNLLQRPFTKRGVLGIVHSTFDPLGLASPSLLQGKLIMREIMPQKGKIDPEGPQYDWDDPLPDHHKAAWDEWTSSLEDVALIKLPRSYKPLGFGEVSHREVHCFCDASKDAIGFVIYLRSFNAEGEISVSFIYASSKVSPRAADTIPRLELCAAYEAVLTTSKVLKELGLHIDSTFYYSDSLVVLGYLNNKTKQFSRFVARRIEVILQFSSTEQWCYVSSGQNAGDIASRPHSPRQLIETCWLTGPPFLLQNEPLPPMVSGHINLPEVKKEVSTLLTVSQPPNRSSLPSEVAKITTRWSKAVSIVGVYIQLGRILLKRARYEPAELAERSEKVLIREAQQEFCSQILLLKDSKPLPKKNNLLPLSPFIDEDDILRVGGRLSSSDFPPDVKNPILLPPRHPITKMIIARYHRSVQHQGRILTMGALRQGGFHILSGSRVIKLFLAECVMCRRIRGKPTEQMMAPLPKERLETLAPFDHVGIDFFGPYLVHDGRTTRRSNATKKVWVMLVTCLASRACHVEVVPSMDTSGFELALRRFLALRGKISSIVSDQGSNFKGALNQSMDFSQCQKVAAAQGIRWSLNPPLASNFGGVFERKIGAIKSVFNATLQLMGKRDLSRDEFTTFIVEATAIVNSTPLWEVSNSPDDPCPLSPARLLTLKDDPHPPPIDTFSPTDLLQYGKRRWRRVMYLADQFWIRWRRFYASELQERRKWTTPNRNISVGDIVLLKGNAKRNQWPLGRITETLPGDDGLVRRVKIRLGKAGERPPLTLERSIRDTILVLPAIDGAPE